MKNVFITGSGRSGTSMLAGMFAKQGYFFGNNLYPPREANPKGFYEDEKINSLNENIILDAIRNAASEGIVDRPSDCYRTGQLWLARFPVDMKFAANEVQRLKINKETSHLPFCFKDPRFCFTLDSWLQIASNYVVLCIFRNPASTVASILRECHNTPYLFNFPISVEYAFTIWRESYWRLLRLYKNHKNIYFIHYEDILNGTMIGKLEGLVGSELDRTFPEASLNRSLAELPIDDKSKLIFDALLDISKDDLGRAHNSKRRKSIRQVEDKLLGSGLYTLPRAKDQWVETIHKTITEQDPKLERVSNELAELQKTFLQNSERIESAYESLAERDAQVQSLSQELSQTQAGLTEAKDRSQSLEKDKTERDAQVQSLSQELSQTQAGLTEAKDHSQSLGKDLAERDDQITTIKSILSERDQTIHEIYASRSWRLTSPLRWIKILLLRIARLLILFAKAVLPGRSTEKLEVLRFVYRKLPLPIAFKERMRNFVVWRFPFVRNTLFHGKEVKVISEKEDESKYLYARSLPKDDIWVLVAEQRIPTPDKTSGSTRLYAILSILAELGFKITFISYSKKNQYHWILDNEEEIKPYEADLASKGISVFYGVNDALRHLKNEGYKYRYAFLSYPEVAYQYIPLIRAYAINAEIIYDTVDLHGLRYAREAEIKNDKALKDKAKYYDKMERLNIECSDLVIAITEDERKQIHSLTPEEKVEIIPNIHAILPPTTSLSDRKDLLFIGHYLHSPNEDAVKYFVKDIFPKIQKAIPGINFYILGSSMTMSVEALACSHIKAVGYVKDPTPYFDGARVFVAPLRYGAGMKGKIGHSISLGLPVVTTEIGAEGMELSHGENVLIADSSDQFADEVIKLYTDNSLWNLISKGGLRHIEEKFSHNTVRDNLKKIFNIIGEKKQGEDEDNDVNTKKIIGLKSENQNKKISKEALQQGIK